MHELTHLLGFCGEQHPTLVSFLLEYPQLKPIFNLKTYYINKLKTWSYEVFKKSEDRQHRTSV